MIYYIYEYLDYYWSVTYYFIFLEPFLVMERAEEYKRGGADKKRAGTREDFISRQWKL